MEKLNKVHVVGAGGIGLSAVAKLLKHAGKEVSGSDVSENEAVRELKEAGIKVAIGHTKTNVPEGTDLLVYSSAVPHDNPERATAKENGVRELSYFEFIGEYSKGKRTIAVSGTNGKSSTTALLGLMLERAALDPTVIVGSKVASFPDRNLRLGESDLFVVEACEHEANMLHLSPQTIVLTNIEADHLDYYRDREHVRATFQEYVDRLPADGLLIRNADDELSVEGIRSDARILSFGIDHEADCIARDISVDSGRQQFEIVWQGRSIGKFSLALPGRFNVENALAAAAAALELGVSPDSIRATLEGYRGIWRRFERLGERAGAPVISDYGHHPTAIRATLEGTRVFFPDRKIVLAFQPHQHNRTKKLFHDFVESFDGADELLLVKIFDVAGREEEQDGDVSSLKLAEAIRKRDQERGVDRPLSYMDSPQEALDHLRGKVGEKDVVLIMGAGDIYKIAYELTDQTGQEADRSDSCL